MSSHTGAIVAIIIFAVVIVVLIILGIIFIPRLINNGNSTGVPINNRAGNNTSVADFRPVVLTKSDLKKFCNESSSCELSTSSCGSKSCSSSEEHSSSCSNRSNSSDSNNNCDCQNKNRCSDCKKLPCPFKGKCRSLSTVDISKGGESCSESSGSKLWSSSNSCDGCNDNCKSESDKDNCKSESCSTCCSGDSMEAHMNQKDFFTALDMKVVTFKDLKPDQIKDITDNGSTVFALKRYDATKIVAKKCKGGQCEITSKISLDRIIAFQGSIYGVSSGTLYQRDPSSVGRKTWFWYTIQGVPTGITWITKTLDDKYLWIQTSDKGYLFNCRRKLVDTIDIKSNIRRFFGRTVNTIGDLNTTTHELVLVECNKKFSNIGAAVFNYNNEVIFIRPPQLDVVSDIRIVLWKPYYLIK